jgi:protein-L-isoaspartate O-methyltransferase
MIIPVGPTGGTQRLTLVTKTDGTISTRELSPVRFVPFLRNEN